MRTGRLYACDPSDPERRRRLFRSWGLEAPTVRPEAFLPQEAAADLLRARTSLSVGALIGRHILQPAFLEDGTEGVTRESVEAELRWRREANFWRRLRRRLGGIVHWM